MQTVPRIRRLYLAFEQADAGRMRLRLSAKPPETTGSMVVLITRGMVAGDEQDLDLEVVTEIDSGPEQTAAAVAAFMAANPVQDGQDATPEQIAASVATYLSSYPVTSQVGTVSVGQTATVAINLGDRELTVPLAGVAKGQRLVAFCDSHRLNGGAQVNGLPAGYWLFGVVSRTDGQVTVMLRAPLLAIGSSYQLNLSIHRIG